MQDADLDRAFRDPEAERRAARRERDVADEHESRVERSEQLDDAAVGIPVPLHVTGELDLVARLLAERLDRADARHGLDEVHDELRGGRAGLAEVVLRLHLEPAREHPERHEETEQDEARLPVERHERDAHEAHEQHALHELVEARIEELADRVEVAGLPRDDPPGGVLLVELETQPLCVQEDPLAQVDQDGLRHPRGQHRVPRDEHGAADTRDEIRHDDGNERQPVRVVAQRRAIRP